MRRLTVQGLAQDIDGLVRFKRALGCRYEASARLLYQFHRFALSYTRRASSSPMALDELVKAWLAREGTRKPVTTASQFGTIRELCRYRRRRDPQSYVPERSLAPRRGPKFLPYLLSHAEVRALLLAARRHPGQKFGGHVLYLLLVILYCTGLRLGEALRLQLPEVDLHARTFLIKESKGRTRIVPFGADLARLIQRYLRQRARTARAGTPAQTLLLGLDGSALGTNSTSNVIRKLWRRLGVKPARGRLGPRPYDLRHAFAVHRLTRWYAQGVDLHARLPWLSAYLGHENLLGTEIYLHATPQLLRTASQRFARRFKALTP
jgi:integrase/recombinase XerD